MSSISDTAKAISDALVELGRLARASRLLVVADLLEELTGVVHLEADAQQRAPQPGSTPSTIN
jgi:hypothetical protein